MVFDEQGRIFVAESPVFPPGVPDFGRAKLLEDTNGDGRPDRAIPAGPLLPSRVQSRLAVRDRASDAEGRTFITSGCFRHRVLLRWT